MKIKIILQSLFICLLLISCEKATKENDISNLENLDFSDSLELAKKLKNKNVKFFGWGGDEDRNNWLKNYLVPKLKKNYDINLEIVPLGIDDILSKLLEEKSANVKKGTIDMIWINGENFYSAKENGLLYGPFANKLPNYKKYIDNKDIENQKDFGFDIDGYEVPYGKAQFVFIADSKRVKKMPENSKDLLEYIKNNNGRFTYAAMPDFTSSAFLRVLIYDILDKEVIANINKYTKKEELKEVLKPVISYLKEIKPYLWREGRTYPANIGQLDKMFQDGELDLIFSYSPYHSVNYIEKGIYDKSVRSFLFEKGTVGNTNYIAISNKSPNKIGAMIVINEIISVSTQLSQYDTLKTLPVISQDKLNENDKKAFDKVEFGNFALSHRELFSKRLPELPANLIPIIEEIWYEEIARKDD